MPFQAYLYTHRGTAKWKTEKDQPNYSGVLTAEKLSAMQKL